MGEPKKAPQDDIDSIMEELDKLQSEMEKAAGPELRAIQGGKSEDERVIKNTDKSNDSKTDPPKSDPIDVAVNVLGDLAADNKEGPTQAEQAQAAADAALTEVDSESTPDSVADHLEVEEHHEETLDEFRGSDDEPSMEETLGHVEEEDESDSKSLLHQAINSESSNLHKKGHEEICEKADEDHSEAESHKSIESPSLIEEDSDYVSFDSDPESGTSTESEAPVEAPVFSSTSSEGTLQMNLSGNLKLQLKYDYNGEAITIGFKDNMLQVQMTDGTEFKIPVKKKNLSSSA